MSPARRRGLGAAWAVASLALALTIAHSALGVGTDGMVWHVVFATVFALSALLCLARAAWVSDERAAWIAIGAGICLHAGGWVVDDVVYDGVARVPSLCDPFWLGAYLGFYPGIVLLGRERFARRGVGMWLDGLLGGLALGAAVAATALQASLARLDAQTSAVGTAAAYPLADIALLTFLATMFASSWRPSRSGAVFVCGLLVLAAVDSTFAIDSVYDGWIAGNAYDPLWALAMLLLGTSAWLPARHAPVVGSGARALLFPSAFGAIALAVLVYGQTAHLNPIAITLAVLALAAIMIRMALLLRETATLAVSRKLSLTDDLTGLGNRRSFTAEVANAIADGRPFALLMIDLDQFKELNDTLGHHLGDELLGGVGPRLCGAAGTGDVVARLGGDEFGVLLRGAGAEEATAAARRLRAALARPFSLAGISLHVGASVGIAVFPDHARDPSELLRHADVAMYGAKRGRTGHEVYATEGDHHSRDRLELAGEMRRALADDELALYYQPAAALDTGALIGVEALVRWRHPDRGLLAPAAFLPAVEHTAIMRELSRRVLAMAICQAGAWFRLDRPWRVAVNLSSTDLLDRALVDDVSALLRRYGTPARRITLEVTESVLMTDPARAIQVLGELRGLGVSVALDDFGTGWSSLTHLQRMPVDEIKIDRSFVAAMATDSSSAAIVSSTVDLAHALGLRVVAEGIEDEATWTRLRAVGCDAAQGFHLSRPLPPGELEATVEDIGDRSRIAAAAPLTAV
ncbi:MAG TPA: bifunctional diguanylate cyclase/phosphodiesterase [Solirubrobacteraceae bacterium]|nr:bifunctional diguanylate cyclase/phosphodiesterase [Solirubrobacteraceae bacterium]